MTTSVKKWIGNNCGDFKLIIRIFQRIKLTVCSVSVLKYEMPIPLISPIPTLPNEYNYLQTSHTSLEPVRAQGYNQALQVVTQVPTYFNILLLIINNLIFKLVFNKQVMG